MLRAVATNVHSGRCVVAEVVLPRVESVRPRSGLTNVTMELEAKYSAGYVVAELFDLFSDISKEGVAGPAADHHHDKDGALSEVHCHSSPGADGVGADLVGSDAEAVLANGAYGCSQRLHHLGRSDVFDAVVSPNGRYRGTVGGARVCSDPLDYGGPLCYRAEDWVAGGAVGDGVHSFILLLPLEGDGYDIGRVEPGVVVLHGAAILEEPNPAEFDDVCAPLLLLRDFEVLARPAGVEEGADAELADRALRLGELKFGYLSEDSDRERFLLGGVWVLVLEPAEEPR